MKCLFLLIFSAVCLNARVVRPWNSKKAHPAIGIHHARPLSFEPHVTGVDILSNGDVVICTADPLVSPRRPMPMWSKVYQMRNVNSTNRAEIKPVLIADNLSEAMGIKVVDDEIYVSDKYALVKLTGKTQTGFYPGKDTIAVYPSSVAKDAGPTDRDKSHYEFPFGLLYREGYFYVALSASVRGGGAAWAEQPTPSRGCIIKINKNSGKWNVIAAGFRTPAAIAWGPGETLWAIDNEGGWRPANTIFHVKPGHTYGYPTHPATRLSRGGNEVFPDAIPPGPAAVLAEHRVISQSLGQMIEIPRGPFKGQYLIPDVSQGGLRRLFLEKVNGEYQGAIFSFSGGLEANMFRSVSAPDGNIYMGGLSGYNFRCSYHARKKFGLQKISFKKEDSGVFDILKVHSRKTGLELVFTKPVGHKAKETSSYTIRQWWYYPTAGYSGPARHPDSIPTDNWNRNQYPRKQVILTHEVRISSDNKKVFLNIPELRGPKKVKERLSQKEATMGMVTHIQIAPDVLSENGDSLWVHDTWYTLNAISQSKAFDINGCANPAYQEYNPRATFDDGSCETKVIGFYKVTKKEHPAQFGKNGVLEFRNRGLISLAIINLQGKVVLKRNLKGPAKIDLGIIKSTGLHFLLLKTSKTRFSKRIILN